MQWPNDADGDTFRLLAENNFDFNKEYEIDFNVDFKDWPLSNDAIAALRDIDPNVLLMESNRKNSVARGLAVVKIKARLNYNMVVEAQKKLTRQFRKYGGWCKTWGVMSE